MSLIHRLGFSAYEAEYVFLKHAAAAGALPPPNKPRPHSSSSLQRVVDEEKGEENSVGFCSETNRGNGDESVDPLRCLLETSPSCEGVSAAVRMLKRRKRVRGELCKAQAMVQANVSWILFSARFLSAQHVACAELLAWVVSPSDRRSQHVLAREMLSFSKEFSLASDSETDGRERLQRVLESGRAFFGPIQDGALWTRLLLSCAMRASSEACARYSASFLIGDLQLRPQLLEIAGQTIKFGADRGDDAALILRGAREASGVASKSSASIADALAAHVL